MKSFRCVPMLFLAVVMLFSLSCTQESKNNKINLSEREQIKIAALNESPEGVFRVAIAGVVSPTETHNSYGQLISFLGEALHQNTEIVQRGTYAEINNLIKLRTVDLAFVCTLAYVKGNEDFGMELLVVPEVNGQTVYNSYIIVPVNSGIKSVEELKGKRFAFTDPMSNTGRLSPAYLLYQMGETSDSFFKEHIFTYSHDKSIRAVAEGIVDGAAVDSLVYEYMVDNDPEISDKVRIIHRSQPFGIPPVVVHPAMDDEVKASLRSWFLNINQDETGMETLNDLKVDRFVLGSDVSYESIRTMEQNLGW